MSVKKKPPPVARKAPKKPPFATEDISDFSRPSDRKMTDDAYQAEALRNYVASQTAYQTLKDNARRATSNDAPTEGPISDEKIISPSDFSKQAAENYRNSKKAYFGQISKVRAGTELARPPSAASRPPTAQSKDYDPDSAYAKKATENYLKAKETYKEQVAKTRKATQFAGDPVSATETPRISSDAYATQSRENYAISKKAYTDMLERQ